MFALLFLRVAKAWTVTGKSPCDYGQAKLLAIEEKVFGSIRFISRTAPYGTVASCMLALHGFTSQVCIGLLSCCFAMSCRMLAFTTVTSCQIVGSIVYHCHTRTHSGDARFEFTLQPTHQMDDACQAHRSESLFSNIELCK